MVMAVVSLLPIVFVKKNKLLSQHLNDKSYALNTLFCKVRSHYVQSKISTHLGILIYCCPFQYVTSRITFGIVPLHLLIFQRISNFQITYKQVRTYIRSKLLNELFSYLLLIFEFTEFQIPSADFKQLIYTSQKISMIHKYWQKQRKKCISEISMRCNRRAISANQSILHNISIFRRWVLWFKP